MKLEHITERPSEPTRSRPILFVHGMWLGAWCWQEHFLPYFAQHGYETHAISLRGHGTSEGQDKLTWTPLSSFVDDVLSTIDKMAEPPILVGHSMGGMIVQHVSAARPIPAAVLLGSAPPRGLSSAAIRALREQPLAFFKSNLTLDLTRLVDHPDRCRELLFNAATPDAEMASFFERIKNQGSSYRAFMDMMLFNLPKPDKVSTPMLVLGGDKDGSITRAEVEATAAAYNTDAVFFPDTGHQMMLESSWQDTADHILAWLDSAGL